MKTPSSFRGISAGTLKWAVFLGVANFLIFVFVAVYLGGIALCGGRVGGTILSRIMEAGRKSATRRSYTASGVDGACC
jgi:hypothetical protein